MWVHVWANSVSAVRHWLQLWSQCTSRMQHAARIHNIKWLTSIRIRYILFCQFMLYVYAMLSLCIYKYHSLAMRATCTQCIRTANLFFIDRWKDSRIAWPPFCRQGTDYERHRNELMHLLPFSRPIWASTMDAIWMIDQKPSAIWNVLTLDSCLKMWFMQFEFRSIFWCPIIDLKNESEHFIADQSK